MLSGVYWRGFVNDNEDRSYEEGEKDVNLIAELSTHRRSLSAREEIEGTRRSPHDGYLIDGRVRQRRPAGDGGEVVRGAFELSVQGVVLLGHQILRTVPHLRRGGHVGDNVLVSNHPTSASVSIFVHLPRYSRLRTVHPRSIRGHFGPVDLVGLPEQYRSVTCNRYL
eukprot:1196420-Prorocentrum_minimum.AAC.7